MRKAHFFAALALAICIPGICFSSARAQSPSVQLIITEQMYGPGKPIEGLANIRLGEFMSEGQLKVCIGSSCSQITVNLSQAKYQFRQYGFTYKINANGKNEWYEYPEKKFSFQVKAEGTCGNEQCHSSSTCECNDLCLPPSSAPYSCPWELRSAVFSTGIRANENWKGVFDARQVITPPVSFNDGIVWSEIANSPSSGVQTTMRESCGDMGQIWIKDTLEHGNFESIPGSTKKKINIGPFDASSLTSSRQLFVDGDCSQPYVCGGIYVNDQLLTSGYTANGTTGEIVIDSYNPMATYNIVFLPANGPLVCGRTTYKVLNSTTWEASSISQTGYLSYDQPFSKTYTQNELPYTFSSSSSGLITPPDCPLKSPEEQYACTKKVISYSASKTSDSSGGKVVFSFNEAARTASASLSSPDLTTELVKTVNLSEFPNLKAPSSAGEYSLLAVFSSGGYDLDSDYVAFTVCHDSDKDGFCRETGCKYCGDCNDTNPKIYPGARELCNNMDDDCDGLVDEDFMAAGSKLGTQCSTGICAGKWVCSSDKLSVVCNRTASPKPETCNNGLDDDCDGVIDETYETDASGNPVKVCDVKCKDGIEEVCKKLGECSKDPGKRTCIKGEWTICRGGIGPAEEVCNGKDDNCDGIIDDIGDSTSPSETLCACTNQPADKIPELMAGAETCGNGLDDNCDEQIDEGCVCTPGEANACGNNRGICSSRQTCIDGQWGGCQVIRGPDPEGEICYNSLDDNCNGKVDENCDPAYTCRNGKQDSNEDGVDCGGACPEECEAPGIPYGWILLAGGVILLIVVFTIGGIRKN